MTDQFTNNTKTNRFEYHTGGATAFASYRKQGQTLFIDYVEAPPELRGTGAAGKLMQYIVDQAKQDKLSITPICSYAASWLKRHQQKGE